MSPPARKKSPAINAADQSPFHWRTLLHAQFFVSYCEENGVHITEEILERLHEIGTLFPALRVEHGIHELKDEEGKMSYACASFFIDYRKNWLQWYEEKHMTHTPAMEPFIPWSQGRTSDERYATPDEAGYAFTNMYDKRQLFALKIALDQWKHRRYSIHPRILQFNEDVRERVRAYNAFLRFFHDIEELFQKWAGEKYEIFRRLKKENAGVERDALYDWKSELKEIQLPILRARAQAIANKHGMDVTMIKKWRIFLGRQSALNELRWERKALTTYLQNATEDALIAAEDSNCMIMVLNDFLYVWQSESRSVREVLLEITSGKVISCVVCGKLIMVEANVSFRKFCSALCKRKYEANRKKDKRMLERVRI